MGNIEEIIERNRIMWEKSFIRAMPVEFPTLYLEITSNCNRSCGHCLYDHSKERDMDPALIENVLNFAKDNYVFSVTFAGAEPLTRFDRLIKPFITNERFNDVYFMLQSNGDLLTERVADILNRANNSMVHLSLDGPNQEIHDSLKGNGSYENTIKAVNFLKQRIVPYGFFVTVTRDNFDSMEETVEHAVDLGAVFIHIIGYKAIGPKADLNKMLTAEQEAKRYELKKKIKEKYPYLSVGRKGCNIGISSDGYFSYCPFLVNVVTRGQQVSANTPHREMLAMFREINQRYTPLLNNVEECPLIEDPTGFIEFTQKMRYATTYRDMLKEGTDIHKRAVEIARGFKELRN